MPRPRLSLVLILLPLAAAGARAQRAPAPADTADPCDYAMSQHAMTLCADTVARRSDAALNQVYRRLLARTEARRRPLLRAAERRWIAFRDAHCLHEAALYEGGSMYPMQLLYCRASLSDARREQLQGVLDHEASR